MVGHGAAPLVCIIPRKLVEVVAYLLSEVAAAGVDHNAQQAVLILLQLYKMISAAQRADLVVSRLDLAAELGLSLVFVKLLHRVIKCV